MAAKGKWAQGIQPRHFSWIIQDHLAICERPGGFGTNHRKVRRQEEIIWVREQGFDLVVSISSAPHNLHNYDELAVKWQHWPFPPNEDMPRFLDVSYTELRRLLSAKKQILVHQDELSDRLVGFLAGYLVWNGMVPEPPRAIALMEQITGRQLDATGRSIVGEAAKLDARPPEGGPLSGGATHGRRTRRPDGDGPRRCDRAARPPADRRGRGASRGA